eukprot:scaffold1352_cov144-Cylindrotheca_fusiformis.AAC.15
MDETSCSPEPSPAVDPSLLQFVIYFLTGLCDSSPTSVCTTYSNYVDSSNGELRSERSTNTRESTQSIHARARASEPCRRSLTKGVESCDTQAWRSEQRLSQRQAGELTPFMDENSEQ